MFHIKFCAKCDRHFGGFLKIHIICYKYILKINNKDDAQWNYLSFKPLLSLLVALFIKKTKCLSIFFSNSEFGIRVYRGKIDARREGISLYTFLKISPRKINILKKTKLGRRELNEVDDINVEKMLLNTTNVLKSTTKMSKKWKKIKVLRTFLYRNML